MFTNCAKVPLSVKGLRPRVSFPHAEPERLVISVPCLIQTRAHQCFADATTEPLGRHVQPHQLDRLDSFDLFRRLTCLKLCVTCGLPLDFRDQESRIRMGQLSRLLRDVEV